MTETINCSEVRNDLSRVVTRVEHKGVRLILLRNGRPACAMVSVEDLEVLEALEDRLDIEAADRAMALDDGTRISAEDVEQELGV